MLFWLEPTTTSVGNFLTCMPLPLQVNLGNMYYNGLGVTKDRRKAKEMYRLAADKDKNAKTLLEEIESEEKKEAEDSPS